jgi:hypothetical protein
MEEDEVMAMSPDNRIVLRALPASAEYSYILTIRQPVFDSEFVKNMVHAKSDEAREQYFNELLKKEYVLNQFSRLD